MTKHELQNNFAITLPERSDVFGSIDGLVRLQETYQLPTDDLSQGVIHGIAADEPLSGYEMHAMGKSALKSGHFHLAVQWLERAVACKGRRDFVQEDVLTDLADAYQLVR